jgi:large subunit ribosomal protein L25
MATFSLGAKPRTIMGKQAAKEVRRQGFVPGNLYGHGMTPVSLQVTERELLAALHTKAGENVVISLQVEGVQLKESICLIKELQHNPVTDKINHVDFTVISMTEKIDVKVPITLLHSAEAPGVKEGGVLEMTHHELEVECLPTDIPEKIVISVKAMKIGDAIHVKDLAMPQGVTCKLDEEAVVVSLHPPMKEEVAGEEVAPGEPEVIEKGKKPEEGAEAAAAAPAAAKKADKKE